MQETELWLFTAAGEILNIFGSGTNVAWKLKGSGADRCPDDCIRGRDHC
jgi:hypothetical protein